MNQLEILLTQRYGGNGSTYLDFPSTPVIETLLRHRSIRSFSPEPLQPGTLEMLIAAGQSASTSSMMQTWSAVAIQDPGRKDALAALAGDQDFIRQAPLFLVFCADLSRLTAVCEWHGESGAGLEKTDMFVMGAVDAALAAQSVGTAAESLGLGFCFVGAVRNDSRRIVELLGLPPRVFPLVGMAIGWPDASEDADIKPRLPMDEVLHRERWDGAKDHQALISSYDEALNKFYEEHGKHGREPWSKHMAGIASSEKQDGREHTRQVLEEGGFGLK
ncbi:hypothetical protein CPLU01_00970 [Colletotrichum plurivorum]|uniref:Nitroreductase domain-containing protein n=1 Tax=Colletotrichum plurivorum TaxID=2175906 RepID=A0A8H6U4D3_9PEZI|nr:hypothetical protein CPLU01_00970 [Colletotrichum plurivorum]